MHKGDQYSYTEFDPEAGFCILNWLSWSSCTCICACGESTGHANGQLNNIQLL